MRVKVLRMRAHLVQAAPGPDLTGQVDDKVVADRRQPVVEGAHVGALAPEAARYFKSGAPFLQRYLPFWLANLADRMGVALLAIVNPVGVVPFFIHFTQHLTPEQRRRTIRVSSFSAFLVIAISALAGLKVIEFFGISLASFQVGGGTLLLISALQMLNAQPAESRSDDVSDGQQRADAGDSIAVVPLTIPLLTGPATISTMVIYADQARHWWHLAALVGYGVVVESWPPPH